MSKLSAEDEAQLEYIRQWHEMKEEKKRAKVYRKIEIIHYMTLAKIHFKFVFIELYKCAKILLGKEV